MTTMKASPDPLRMASESRPRKPLPITTIVMINQAGALVRIVAKGC
ncbi:hypothetical protein NKI59_21705 [Mesorhizobium sp. M0598]